MILLDVYGEYRLKGDTLEDLIKQLAKKRRCTRENITIEIDDEHAEDVHPMSIWVSSALNSHSPREFLYFPEEFSLEQVKEIVGETRLFGWEFDVTELGFPHRRRPDSPEYRWRLTAQRFDNGLGNLPVQVAAEIPAKATKADITTGIRTMMEDAYDWAEEALDSRKFKLPAPPYCDRKAKCRQIRDYRRIPLEIDRTTL